MPLPTPEPGLVVSYAYLWHSEHRAGRDEGRKNRPAVIVLAVERANEATVVTVLPITHRLQTGAPAAAIEIPQAIKRHRGSTTPAHGSFSTKATNSNGPATICAESREPIAMISVFCRHASSPRADGLSQLAPNEQSPIDLAHLIDN